jgi:hypothetical protein
MDWAPSNQLVLLTKLAEIKVSRPQDSLKIEPSKCMPKRQAGHFLSKMAVLAKFPA